MPRALLLLLFSLMAGAATAQKLGECIDPKSAADVRQLVGGATRIESQVLTPGAGPSGAVSYCTSDNSHCWYMRPEGAARILSADSSFARPLPEKLLRPLRSHRSIEARTLTVGTVRWALLMFEPVDCTGEGCNNRFFVGIPAMGSTAEAFVLPDVTPFIPLELRFYSSRNRLAILSSERVQPGRWRLLFGPEVMQRELGEYITVTDGGLKLCALAEE